jgi:hypothetical protein
MSRLIATILLAILMFPLASVFYLVVFVSHEQLWRWSSISYSWSGRSLLLRTPHDHRVRGAGLLTWAFIAVYWWALWRKRVRGRPGDGSGAVLAPVPHVARSACRRGRRHGDQRTVRRVRRLCHRPLLWVFGTVLAWRESPAEHAERIASLGGAGALTCPTCGYNLTA